MVVAHNLLALNSSRQLGITTGKQKKSAEKLSSGYRINRSADDAAGLTISEKMRWQIRGLDRGALNIMDGISLIDTADGAMAEVHSILQRVRELTVQAYNDTYTQSDRDAIQCEVDNCLQEINRIAEDTTFNTKQILKGNPVEIVQVTEDMSVDYITTQTVTKDLPDWLANNVDKRLEVHASYTGTQDVSGVMYNYDGVNDSTKTYYGPADASVPDGFTNLGQWTSTITDNPSAKMDFSGLLAASDAEELYQYIYDLIGCKISYPCGTCSTQVNSICFSGSEESLTTKGFEASSTTDISGNVNLSTTSFTYNGETYTGYFEAVRALMDKYNVNYDDDTANDDAGEAAEAAMLAQSIARDLRDKTVDALGKTMDGHFDRVIAGSDDYSLIVYDYRDASALTNLHAADSDVKTSAKVKYRMQTRTMMPGLIVEAESPMKIMCGALNSSYINLHLTDLSLDSLGLSSYKINRYKTKETYSDSYQQKLVAWENNATEVTETRTYTERVVKSQTPPGYVNGEPKPPRIEFEEEERTYTITKKVYGPKPAAQDGDIKVQSVYDPDSLELVDDAIEIVSGARALLGATKNRLEHAYSINKNSAENSQSAESRIRDTDMAEEMVEYSKHNILAQAGQAMLAQANQSTQGILALLQ